jgi:hypothetical protein
MESHQVLFAILGSTSRISIIVFIARLQRFLIVWLLQLWIVHAGAATADKVEPIRNPRPEDTRSTTPPAWLGAGKVLSTCIIPGAIVRTGLSGG